MLCDLVSAHPRLPRTNTNTIGRFTITYILVFMRKEYIMTTKRKIGIIGALLGAVGVVAFATLRQSLPQTKGKLSLSQLQQPVEVLRDRWGVPHIYAQNSHDLFVAEGLSMPKIAYGKWKRNGDLALGAYLKSRVRVPSIPTVICASSDWVAQPSGMSRPSVSNPVPPSKPTSVGLTLISPRIAASSHLKFRLLRHTPEPWSIADVLVWGKVTASICQEIGNKRCYEPK
jgi:penicillin amidase